MYQTNQYLFHFYLVSNCLNRNKSFKNNYGGAIKIGPKGKLLIQSSSFYLNKAEKGGAIFNEGELVVSESSFVGNYGDVSFFINSLQFK